MHEPKPTVKRGPGNPRPVTYPIVLHVRPRVMDAEVLDRYCTVTHRRASVGFCRKFYSGGREEAVAPVCGRD